MAIGGMYNKQSDNHGPLVSMDAVNFQFNPLRNQICLSSERYALYIIGYGEAEHTNYKMGRTVRPETSNQTLVN